MLFVFKTNFINKIYIYSINVGITMLYKMLNETKI